MLNNDILHQHNLQNNYRVGLRVYPLLIYVCNINLFLNILNCCFQEVLFISSHFIKNGVSFHKGWKSSGLYEQEQGMLNFIVRHSCFFRFHDMGFKGEFMAACP